MGFRKEGEVPTPYLLLVVPDTHSLRCVFPGGLLRMSQRELDADIGAMSSVRKEALPCRAHLVPLRERIRVTTSLLMQIK